MGVLSDDVTSGCELMRAVCVRVSCSMCMGDGRCAGMMSFFSIHVFFWTVVCCGE